jgi:CheY-like chemotaxis protein
LTYPEIDSPDGLHEDTSERFAHEMASPLAAFRMYAQALAELMPALLAAHDRYAGTDGVPPIPPDYRRVLPETPERLLHLTEEVDRIARHYRTLLAPRKRTQIPEASGKRLADPVDTGPAAPQRQAAPDPDGDSGRPRALLVEDDIDSRELASILLELSGWESAAVGDGAAALALLEAEPFDLVLMDCQLPGIDGCTATARLRANGPARRIPVIGLTASPDGRDRERGLAAGMDDFIVKPLTESHLKDLARRYLGRILGRQ